MLPQGPDIARRLGADNASYVSTPHGRDDAVAEETAGKNAFSHTIGLTVMGPCNSRRSHAR